MKGWSKVKGAARHAGVSEKTLRGWLKKDLRYSRLPSGTILIKFSWINEFLENFEVQEDEVSQIVGEIEREMDIRKIVPEN